VRAIQRVSCPVNDSNTYIRLGFTALWARRGIDEFWGFPDATLLHNRPETNTWTMGHHKFSRFYYLLFSFLVSNLVTLAL